MRCGRHPKIKTPFLLDIKLDKTFIHEDPSIICIIHGTKDSNIPIENSRNIIELSQHGRIIEIENADHSFKNPAEERSLIKATRNFLSGEL